jgi:hypothetical protein
VYLLVLIDNIDLIFNSVNVSRFNLLVSLTLLLIYIFFKFDFYNDICYLDLGWFKLWDWLFRVVFNENEIISIGN